MKKLTLASVVIVSFVLGGCQSTIEGIGKSMGDLVGGPVHEGFAGKFIEQGNVDEFKQRDDALTGEGRLISYSGLDIPADQIRQSHVVDSPELEAYLNNILDNILLQWSGTPVNVQIQVVHSQTFAPYADAYGMISVPLGAINNVESEDELALLIAHEASHILLRHHERDAIVQQDKKNVEMLATAVIAANVVRDTKMTKVGGSRKLTYMASAQGQDNISKAAIYNAVIQTLSDSVWSTAWQRTQEGEADLLGFDMAVAAGYSPRANAHVLQRLADFQGKQDNVLSVFWAQKKEALSAAFDDMNLNAMADELNGALMGGLTSGLSFAANKFQKLHNSPEDRDKAVRDYARREYQFDIRRRVNKTSWAGLKANQQVVALLKSYNAAFSASNALAENDLEAAALYVKQSRNAQTSGHPYIREVMYNLRMAQGNRAKAEQNLALITQWKNASPSLFETKIQHDFEHHDYASALESITQAEKIFGSSSKFIVQKAVALSNLSKQEEAVAELDKCMEYDEVKATCEAMKAQIS
ncbi:MAG: M48 family metallopeptidase [Alteromonas sp.]|uniref:M48 family metallopeptidase n=1 Tax=Alteromonas sp. TaxID=232 RepID=UPI0032D98C27